MRIFHFHNGSGGGVLTVIRNLLRHSSNHEIENHVIYIINKDVNNVYQVPVIDGARTQNVFYYSPQWNFYYTIKQLSKFLSDEKDVIVAHDWLELGMVSNLGLKNPVIQILHGDFNYYYDLAILHSRSIDAHICVSSTIEKKLKVKMPAISDKIHFLHFPVPCVEEYFKDYKKIKCAFFVQDLLDVRKQAFLLPQIDNALLQKGISLEWHIAGGGILQENFGQFWAAYDSSRIHFKGLLDEHEIKEILKECTLFLLPSLSEGFPISVVEAMKYGLVPLVSKWDGAIDELIQDGFNGYFLPVKNVDAYVDCISMLARHTNLLKSLAENSKERVNVLFDPVINTTNYENIFSKSLNKKRGIRKGFKAYGSLLDQKFIPNIFVTTIRSMISSF